MIFPISHLQPTSVSLLEFIILNKIKRGVLRRDTTVAWLNGIVPYKFLPGYGMNIFIQKDVGLMVSG
jgi:hypothetical protein